MPFDRRKSVSSWSQETCPELIISTTISPTSRRFPSHHFPLSHDERNFFADLLHISLLVIIPHNVCLAASTHPHSAKMPKRRSPSAQAPSREVLYSNVIHGSPLPVERKPDLATLDAELGMEAQRQQQLHSCDPARYTRAVVLATMDAGLVREFFNRALGIADTPSGTNARGRCLYQACDPALYYSAIEEASFEGVIFPEFFDNIVAHIDYRTVSLHPDFFVSAGGKLKFYRLKDLLYARQPMLRTLKPSHPSNSSNTHTLRLLALHSVVHRNSHALMTILTTMSLLSRLPCRQSRLFSTLKPLQVLVIPRPPTTIRLLHFGSPQNHETRTLVVSSLLAYALFNLLAPLTLLALLALLTLLTILTILTILTLLSYLILLLSYAPLTSHDPLASFRPLNPTLSRLTRL